MSLRPWLCECAYVELGVSAPTVMTHLIHHIRPPHLELGLFARWGLERGLERGLQHTGDGRRTMRGLSKDSCSKQGAAGGSKVTDAHGGGGGEEGGGHQLSPAQPRLRTQPRAQNAIIQILPDTLGWSEQCGFWVPQNHYIWQCMCVGKESRLRIHTHKVHFHRASAMSP